MNTNINAPTWVTRPEAPATPAAGLRQLVNVAGPVATGTAVVLHLVQASQLAEEEGHQPVLSTEQRAHLLALCHVSAQLLGEASLDACTTLLSTPGST